MSSVLPVTSSSPSNSRARQKWKLLSNTFKAISLLKTCETRIMYDVDDLIEEIKSSPVKLNLNRQPSLVAELIDEHKLRENLFQFIKTSTPEDLQKIEEIIENNPKRYIVSPSSPESLLNKPLNNYRPVYEACRLGYLQTVELLLKHGADPKLKCGKGAKENSLDVASRWRHQAVVGLLLETSKWTQHELRRAMKNTSPAICAMIKEKLEDEAVKNCKCLVF